MPACRSPARPSRASSTKKSVASGGCPATWVGQLSVASIGIRLTHSASAAGTSVIVRAVSRYS